MAFLWPDSTLRFSQFPPANIIFHENCLNTIALKICVSKNLDKGEPIHKQDKYSPFHNKHVESNEPLQSNSPCKSYDRQYTLPLCPDNFIVGSAKDEVRILL